MNDMAQNDNKTLKHTLFMRRPKPGALGISSSKEHHKGKTDVKLLYSIQNKTTFTLKIPKSYTQNVSSNSFHLLTTKNQLK